MGAGGSMQNSLVVGTGDADDKRSAASQSTRKARYRKKAQEIPVIETDYASGESSRDSFCFSNTISTSTPHISPVSSAGQSNGMGALSSSSSKICGQSDVREFTRRSLNLPLCAPNGGGREQLPRLDKENLAIHLARLPVGDPWESQENLAIQLAESAKSHHKNHRRHRQQSLTKESSLYPKPEHGNFAYLSYSWADKKFSPTESAPFHQADAIPLIGFEKSSRVSSKEFSPTESSRVSRKEFSPTESVPFQQADAVPLSGLEKSSRVSRKDARSRTRDCKLLDSELKSKSLPSLAASNNEHYGFSIGDRVTTAGGLDASGPWESMGDGIVVALATKKGYLVVEFETGDSFSIKASNLSKLTRKLSAPSVSSAQTIKKQEKFSGWKDGGDTISLGMGGLEIGDQVLVGRRGQAWTPETDFESDGVTATVVGASDVFGMVRIQYKNLTFVREVKLEQLVKLKALPKSVPKSVPNDDVPKRCKFKIGDSVRPVEERWSTLGVGCVRDFDVRDGTVKVQFDCGGESWIFQQDCLVKEAVDVSNGILRRERIMERRGIKYIYGEREC